jgi:hypothetical protein
VIVSGVIMMNMLRVPWAQGTGPSFHSELNVCSCVTRSADPRTKTLQPDSRSSSMSSISNATRVWPREKTAHRMVTSER